VPRSVSDAPSTVSSSAMMQRCSDVQRNVAAALNPVDRWRYRMFTLDAGDNQYDAVSGRYTNPDAG
jgi:hypothetical protein